MIAAHFLQLKGRRYAAFVNADAMGKSMQGAGGALVLGTVYKAMIARTQQSSAMQNKYPEQWLKECFLELQNVFVSFDGSMLASAVIGLLDEDRGFLYYLNAEHPGTVLYRDGKARFIDDERIFRKIGVPDLEGRIFLRTLALEQGDLLFFGSDGRDDLLLGHDLEGRRIINEDETMFLACVEEGRGDLAAIQAAIESRGQLTDDFSLLRVAFREDAPVAQRRLSDQEISDVIAKATAATAAKDADGAVGLIEQLEKDHGAPPKLLSACLRMLLKAGRHRQAAECGERFAGEFPEHAELLHLTALALKLAGRHDAAADFAERMLLRRPDHADNLINLADVHRLRGNTARAVQMIELALALEPANAKALALCGMLKAGITKESSLRHDEA